jgi:ATP phosphoribosyltransferase
LNQESLFYFKSIDMKLTIAIQKSGRLNKSSLELMSFCGFNLIEGNGRLKTRAENFPVEVLFLRDDDIPGYIRDGVADCGIVGENVLAEKGIENLQVEEKLGFGTCRLSLAIPRETNYAGLTYFQGKRIATSYPEILSSFLKSNNIKAEIHGIGGSVEIAPGIGLSDAICDLVSTGSTLLSNGLKEVETILKSQAVLVANQNLNGEKRDILDRLIFRVRANRQGKKNKYILLNAPNGKIAAITKIIPGIKAPTILPLATEGWSSLHSVVNADDFWDITMKLKKEGAEGILVIPIENMIV